VHQAAKTHDPNADANDQHDQKSQVEVSDSPAPFSVAKVGEKLAVTMTDCRDQPLVNSQNQCDRSPRDARNDIRTAHQQAADKVCNVASQAVSFLIHGLDRRASHKFHSTAIRSSEQSLSFQPNRSA
jgi:hypothetical protein